MEHINTDMANVWFARAASIAGLKRNNLNDSNRISEDDCFCGEIDNVVTVGVCDGVSDDRAKYASVGARFFSEYSARYFSEHFDECWDADERQLNALISDFHRSALENLDTYLEKNYPECPRFLRMQKSRLAIVPSELLQYATTMLTALIYDDRLMVFAIGNGACLACRDGKIGAVINFEKTTATPHIAYSGQGDVLRCMHRFRAYVPSDLDAICIMTDGGEIKDGLYLDSTAQTSLTQFLMQMSNRGAAADFSGEKIEAYLNKISTLPSNVACDDMSLAIIMRADRKLKAPPVPVADNPLSDMALYQRMPRPKENKKISSDLNSDLNMEGLE